MEVSVDGDRKDENVLVHNDEFLTGPRSTLLRYLASRGKWAGYPEEHGTQNKRGPLGSSESRQAPQ